MQFERAGRHTINYKTRYGFKSSYYTFVPTPICDIDIKPDEELLELLANAHRHIGLLDGACQYVGNVENITNLFLKKEATASCNIDDEHKFSALDLLVPTKYHAEKMQPVHNYTNALEYGINEMKMKRILPANNVIYDTHKILMVHKQGSEKTGAVRRKQTIIGDIMVTPGYNPPNPETVGSCMADIQRFVKRVDTIDPLIKNALLHYQLEVVHPFESGNGKIGRILILMYLFNSNMLTHTILPLSEFFEANKVEYFDRIKAVHNRGHYEQWVKFFLSMLAISAETSVQRIEKIIQLRNKNLIRIKAAEKDTKYLFNAYQYTEKNIFLDVTSLSNSIGISYNTAARVVRAMVEYGILKLLKKQARNRTYYYAGLLEVFGFSQLNTPEPNKNLGRERVVHIGKSEH